MTGRAQSRRDFLEHSGRLALGAGLAGTLAGSSIGTTSALAVATAKPKRGGILEVSMTDTSTTDRLDPTVPLNTHDIVSTNLIYDGLVRLDQNFKALPALATAWEPNAKGTVWEFTLRDGVTFHDGKPFTAKDVVWSLRRAVDPKGKGTGLPQFTATIPLDGIKAVGKNKVRFNLKQPNFFLPQLLGGFYTLIAQEGTKNFKKPAGTGPFKVESFAPGQLFEARRNEDYWESGIPYLDGVRLVAVPDQANKVQTVVSGTAHLGDSMEPKFIALITGSGKADLLTARGGHFPMMVWQQDKKPFSDRRVMQALKLVVDRKKVVDQIYFGKADISPDIPIPPSDPFFPKGLPAPAHDPEKAKALLKQAGQSGLTFNFYTSQLYPGFVDLPVLYKEMAKAAGITVNIKISQPQTYISSIVLQRPAFQDGWTRQHTMALPPLLYTAGSPYAETNFTDPRVARLFAEATGTSNFAVQKRKVADAAAIIQNVGTQVIPCADWFIWPKKKNLHGAEANWGSFIKLREAYLA